MISLELLKKYNMVTIEEYKEVFEYDDTEGEIEFYKTFLIQTDYICNKIVEGASTWEDYAEEKEARLYARKKIKELINNENPDD